MPRLSVPGTTALYIHSIFAPRQISNHLGAHIRADPLLCETVLEGSNKDLASGSRLLPGAGSYARLPLSDHASLTCYIKTVQPKEIRKCLMLESR